MKDHKIPSPSLCLKLVFSSLPAANASSVPLQVPLRIWDGGEAGGNIRQARRSRGVGRKNLQPQQAAIMGNQGCCKAAELCCALSLPSMAATALCAMGKEAGPCSHAAPCPSSAKVMGTDFWGSSRHMKSLWQSRWELCGG